MKSIPDYNLKPHGALSGLTPFEELEGKVPSRNKFNLDKEVARKERLKQNMKVECCEKIQITNQRGFNELNGDKDYQQIQNTNQNLSEIDLIKQVLKECLKRNEIW